MQLDDIVVPQLLVEHTLLVSEVEDSLVQKLVLQNLLLDDLLLKEDTPLFSTSKVS